MLGERHYMRPEFSSARRPLSLTERLVILCVTVFLLHAIAEQIGFGWFDRLALDPAQLRRGAVWQLVTYMFLHDLRSPFHIVFNMLVLWLFGRAFERMIGSGNFARLYLVAGVFGGFVWVLFNFREPAVQLVGASAGLTGLVAAFATLFPNQRIGLLFLPFTFRAKHFVWGLVAFETYMIVFARDAEVAYVAHLAGILAGFLYARFVLAADSPFRSPPPVTWRQLFPRRLRRAPRLTIVPRPPAGADEDIEPEEFIREKVDPILDKIAREGMGSLTQRERRTLEEARDRMSRKR